MTKAEQVGRLSRPHTYAEDRLGLKLHPKQADVLKDLFPMPSKAKKSHVSFRCSNEVGKTTHTATAAILYALEILNAQVISTAGVWMQVTSQLVPALKGHSQKFPNWRFLDSTISIGGIDRYVGFSTRDEGFAQGFHRKDGMPLLAIIDEAAAVKDVIYNGIEDRCNPDYFLVMGSPLDPAGMFYRIESELSRFYTHHHLNQRMCLTTDGWWIDPESIARKVAKWGKDHPLVKSNVDGEFSDRVEDALLSIGEFEACIASPPEWRGTDRHAFIDFAAGRNKNVFAVRVGNRVWIEKKWTEPNTMATVGECLAIFNRLKREYGFEPEEIEGDADGLGLPIVQRLREVGFNLGAFHGNAKARFDAEFANSISESWGTSTNKIKACDIIIPNDADFKGQILSRKIKRQSDARFHLETKEEMKKRGLDSPDEADALLNAMMPSVTTKSYNFVPAEPDSRGWLDRARDEQPTADIPGAFVT